MCAADAVAESNQAVDEIVACIDVISPEVAFQVQCLFDEIQISRG